MTAFRGDVIVSESSVNNATWNGGATNYVVQANNGDLYLFYVDGNADAVYKKSTDGGLTWAFPVQIIAGTITQLSVWYDRWSGIAAGLIHLAYTDSADGDTKYRSVDTESSDTLGTQTVIFAGTSTASGGCLSITRTRGGNLLCHVVIDAGAEGGFFRSTDAGATWGSRTVNEAIATQDQAIMLPGWAADNQDGMMFFWDASANEISRYLYDDSANTWAETSIATSMADTVATTAFPHFAAAVDIANSRNILVAWSAVDTANADLRAFMVTESAITESTTNVVLDSTDDQGFAAIGIDTSSGDWTVVYGGKSDGSETFNTSMNFYYKTSSDDGATWGSETLLSNQFYQTTWLVMTPRFTAPFNAAWYKSNTNFGIYMSVQVDDGAGGGASGGGISQGLHTIDSEIAA